MWSLFWDTVYIAYGARCSLFICWTDDIDFDCHYSSSIRFYLYSVSVRNRPQQAEIWSMDKYLFLSWKYCCKFLWAFVVWHFVWLTCCLWRLFDWGTCSWHKMYIVLKTHWKTNCWDIWSLGWRSCARNAISYQLRDTSDSQCWLLSSFCSLSSSSFMACSTRSALHHSLSQVSTEVCPKPYWRFVEVKVSCEPEPSKVLKAMFS